MIWAAEHGALSPLRTARLLNAIAEFQDNMVNTEITPFRRGFTIDDLNEIFGSDARHLEKLTFISMGELNAVFDREQQAIVSFHARDYP